jgi:hypothetical protein
MKIMQVSRTKTLTHDQKKAFHAELERFYAAPPKDLIVVADYVAMDQSRSFTLLEVTNLERLHEINKPFTPFVDYEVFEVRPATDK